jgi:hypothetical protein
MKKVSRTIAMVLILVMLACSFTSCLSYVYRSASVPKRVVFAVVDIVFLPVSLLALLIYVIITDASNESDTQVYLANAEHNIHPEYYFLMDKMYSLSEAELATLRQTLSAIPEADRITSLERLTSLSETRRVSLVSAYNSLTETEIIAAIERLNSLSETELVSLLQEFNGLSEAELDSLIEELQSLHNTEYVAAIDYSREKEYMGLSFQY